VTDDEFRAAAKRSADLVRRRDATVKLLAKLNDELAELTQQMVMYAGG
jgi:hypothetical protein